MVPPVAELDKFELQMRRQNFPFSCFFYCDSFLLLFFRSEEKGEKSRESQQVVSPIFVKNGPFLSISFGKSRCGKCLTKMGKRAVTHFEAAGLEYK